MREDVTRAVRPKERLTRRLLSGFALALAIAFSAYLMFNTSKSSAGFGGFWFLALLPATLCALIGYIGDPDRTRSTAFYLLVPPVLVAIVAVASAFVLHEGVICLVMLSPIWMLSGWAGAFLMRAVRGRVEDIESLDRTFQSSFLIIPLVAGVVEAQIPVPHEQVLLSRSLLVQATPAEIWPYAVASRAIGPSEGRWNLTQSVIGVPRPRDVALRGSGVGAVRTAYWGDHINFEERITEWTPGRKLAWTFAFTNSSLQDYTDKHISPDGQFLKIDTGDYTMVEVAPGVTRIALNTRYIAKTHVNPYARLWGEFLLGDVETNILQIIKDRAEAAHGRGSAVRF